MSAESVQNRSFLGAIAAAIKAVCMLLIRGVSVAEEGVAMADKAVKSARLKQAIDVNISMRSYQAEAKAAAQYRQMKSHIQLQEFIDQVPGRQEMANRIGADVDAAITEALLECGVTRAAPAPEAKPKPVAAVPSIA